VKIGDKNIHEISIMTIEDLYDFFSEYHTKMTKRQKSIAENVVKEILDRLFFLLQVGLDYLSIDREAGTLSGGEAQRIRLATQIGAALSGVLYVLDEPSIGLHQRDNQKLIQTLVNLRDIGNTVIVVEHDEDTMRAADFIIDMGPGAGIHGGEIVAKGPIDDVLKVKKSLTTKYLTGESKISWSPRNVDLKKSLKLKGAKANNLKAVNCEIPLNCLTLVTGVSGSGKSSLIHEVLVPAMKSQLHKAHKKLYTRNNYHSLVGVDQIKSLIELDQSAIGRTPHSNPATYTGLFDEIRKLFALTNESQIRGYKPGRFSFNVKGGRCEECEGNGVKKIEMHFLPDVYVTCSECHGSRYNNETLSVLYKGKNISDVLQMTLEEALEFFGNHRKMKRILKTMNDVGLGYIKLGQPATTLSGGEAQRLKLARELAKSIKGHCFYVLDEPTTGLHFQDIQVLLEAVQSLVDQGHSVLIIEHNLDVIKSADHVIDLGPDGGDKGGEILAQCPPKELIKIKKSHTGQYLKPYMK
jgi:excinuclease ABC subunit A